MEERSTNPNYSIIAVHGNVFDRIGFDIAERANRSAELRLKKTLSTLSNMAQKDSIRFQKEKYSIKSQLDRLKMSQLKMRRERLEKSLSLGEGLNMYGRHSRHAETMSRRRRSQDAHESPPSPCPLMSGLSESKEDASNKPAQFYLGDGPGESSDEEGKEEGTTTHPRGRFCNATSQKGVLRRGMTEPNLLEYHRTEDCQQGLRRKSHSASSLPNTVETYLTREESPTREDGARNTHRVGTSERGTNLVQPSLTMPYFSKLPPIPRTRASKEKSSLQEQPGTCEDQTRASCRPEPGYPEVPTHRGTRRHRYRLLYDKSELLFLLHEERERLQERVRAFLAKNNP